MFRSLFLQSHDISGCLSYLWNAGVAVAEESGRVGARAAERRVDLAETPAVALEVDRTFIIQQLGRLQNKPMATFQLIWTTHV